MLLRSLRLEGPLGAGACQTAAANVPVQRKEGRYINQIKGSLKPLPTDPPPFIFLYKCADARARTNTHRHTHKHTTTRRHHTPEASGEHRKRHLLSAWSLATAGTPSTSVPTVALSCNFSSIYKPNLKSLSLNHATIAFDSKN